MQLKINNLSTPLHLFSSRSVTSDALASDALVKELNALLKSETVTKAIDKNSLSLLQEDLVGGIRKR